MTTPVLRLISDHLDRHASGRPATEFLVDGELRLSYADTKRRVDRLAAAMVGHGIARGDRVAYYGNPSAAWWIHFLATTSVGAIWLGLNPKYTPAELDHVVGDAEPSWLFSASVVDGAPALPRLEEIRADHPGIAAPVLLDDDQLDLWCGAAAPVSADDLAARRADVDTMDPAFLVYTSGSTGRPKGALITHRGSNLCNAIAVDRKHLADRRMINNLPVNHVGAIGDISGRVMTGGGTLFFHERFDPARMLQTIEAERLDTVGGVPTMLQLVADHPDFETTDLSSIELIAWGGAAMPAELLVRWQEATGAPFCTMGYGMTEMTGGITYAGLTDSVELLCTTIGLPDDRQEIRVWHPDGRVAEVGEPGEIQTRGDFLMAGYWRNPEATAAAIPPDGWLRTGDLGVLRPDGYYQIVGRLSEMYKSGGYNVYPREVELALEEHPEVAMAAVVSVPDPTYQEVGVAYVMGTSGLAVDELRAFAAERLANYKVPKRIEVLDELPMLPIGKVDKAGLRVRAAD